MCYFLFCFYFPTPEHYQMVVDRKWKHVIENQWPVTNTFPSHVSSAIHVVFIILCVLWCCPPLLEALAFLSYKLWSMSGGSHFLFDNKNNMRNVFSICYAVCTIVEFQVLMFVAFVWLSCFICPLCK